MYTGKLVFSQVMEHLPLHHHENAAKSLKAAIETINITLHISLCGTKNGGASSAPPFI